MTYLNDIYVDMGVKRSVGTSGMQPKGQNSPVTSFKLSKINIKYPLQFPLYFLIISFVKNMMPEGIVPRHLEV